MKFPWDKESIKKISYPADHAITPIKSWINKKLKK